MTYWVEIETSEKCPDSVCVRDAHLLSYNSGPWEYTEKGHLISNTGPEPKEKEG